MTYIVLAYNTFTKEQYWCLWDDLKSAQNDAARSRLESARIYQGERWASSGSAQLSV